MDSEIRNWIISLVAICIGLAVLVGGGCYGYTKYNVWHQRLDGEAQLAKAESTRRVAVLEAQAKKDAAKMLAEAEVERAKGTAQANQIVGESLKGHEEYLRWLWIDKLAEGTSREMIYVPTEAGIPILEAGRKPSGAVESK